MTSLRIDPLLTALESEVLELALAGNGTGLAELRVQLDGAEVVTRTPSGVGFMVKLRIADDAPRPPSGTAIELPIVYGRHPQLRGGAEFLIQIKDGRLNSVEAFCYEGQWPTDEGAFELRAQDAY